MKKLCLLSVLTTIVLSLSAQLKYPVVGTYEKKSAQGMAIYKDKAYLMNEGGRCRVLNLSTGNIERSFLVGSAAKGNHINNACFGLRGNVKDGTPFLYLSECYNSGRCFVEKLSGDTSITVQTIEATRDGKNWRMTNWVVDNENGVLYALTRNRNNHIDSLGNIICHVVKYPIPGFEDGTYVKLSEKDILDQYEIVFPNVLQGSKIRKNKLYLVTGFQQSIVSKESQRAILIIDLKKKKLIKSVDLTYVTTNEPEDLDFYRNYALLYCGQEGGIHKINIK